MTGADKLEIFRLVFNDELDSYLHEAISEYQRQYNITCCEESSEYGAVENVLAARSLRWPR